MTQPFSEDGQVPYHVPQSEQIERLVTWIKTIDPEHAKLVVRWTDEPRITPEGGSGFTVQHTCRAILTGRVQRVQGTTEVEQLIVEDISIKVLRATLAPYPIEVLFRSDNIVR